MACAMALPDSALRYVRAALVQTSDDFSQRRLQLDPTPLLSTASSASARSTGAPTNASRLGRHLTAATTMYREVDMRSWLLRVAFDTLP